ncbi:MAG TPA: tRNA (guanine(10)-N(2))-dimethyltransferase [Thermoplasmatales archaeon]|nr:tRNA (guanine(10)-N(2))-dimethyltransferase [Thermoplasmatales archaeon]
MKTRIVKEGETEFYVPEGKESKKGPGKKVNGFYNPSMELNRDISILVVQWLTKISQKPLKILDGLAASGARGIRIANEVKGDFEVIINDWKKEAYMLIKKNIQHNKLKNAIAKCENVNKLLHENRFDYIDIDPYGTPVPYIDAAIKGIKTNGIIAVTATDTATLCGIYPKTCIRRYFSVPFHSYIMHEVGLRILIGYICREAAKYDRGIEVLLSYATDHYMRIYVKILRGAKRADESLEKVKSVDVSDYTNNITKMEAGPLWTGNLHKRDVLKAIEKNLGNIVLGTKRDIEKLLQRMFQEIDMPLFFYSIDHLSSKLKISPPKLSYVLKELNRRGYSVSRTQFGDTSFKTTAPIEIVYNVFKELEVRYP